MSIINQIADIYSAGAYAKDADALLEIYSPDVIVFDMWDVWVYEGRETWGASVRGWLGSLGENRVKVDFASISQVVTKNWATWCATVRYADIALNGVELRSMENRLSWTLRRTQGRWFVIQEHSSAPASVGDLKVRLAR